MKKYLMLSLSLIAALVLTGCAKKNVLDVNMAEFVFSPADFKVSAGQEVTLNLTNSGAVLHQFVIMKLGTSATIPFDDDDLANVYWEQEVEPGASKTVTFTAPSEPGEYEVVCKSGGHLENGMKATLTVVP